MKTRRIKKDGIVYIVTFDEDDIVDTTQRQHDGKFLAGNHRVVRQIVNNQKAIASGVLPKGFEWSST